MNDFWGQGFLRPEWHVTYTQTSLKCLLPTASPEDINRF